MLALSRKEFESIVIGDDIVVTVLSVDGGQVRIGIEAPKSINIVREELLDHSDDYSYREWFNK